jgi:hypothetical protein
MVQFADVIGNRNNDATADRAYVSARGVAARSVLVCGHPLLAILHALGR